MFAKTISGPIKAYIQSGFSLGYLACILCMMTIIIWSWYKLPWVAAHPAEAYPLRFLKTYLLFFIPFAGGFFLQKLFFTNTGFTGQIFFWLMLVLAPAFFAFRVHFNLHVPWVKAEWPGADQRYWLRIFHFLSRYVVLIPVLLVWYIFQRSQQPFYGMAAAKNTSSYFFLLLCMLPLLFLASRSPSFLTQYPRLFQALPAGTHAPWWKYALFEICYGLDFFTIEVFFRGFLILGLVYVCGPAAIIPAACFYCSIHLGKPLGETISSFFGGLLLGIITWQTKTIWPGFMLHVGIAWIMELLALQKQRG